MEKQGSHKKIISWMKSIVIGVFYFSVSFHRVKFVTQADHLLDEEHCVVLSRFSDFLSPSHMWHFSVGDVSGTLDGMFDLAHREFMNM